MTAKVAAPPAGAIKELRAAQMLENVLGWQRRFQGVCYPILSINVQQQDRILCMDCWEEVPPISFTGWLNKHPEKFSRWDFVGNHGATARRGWRERVPRWSMQVVEHESGLLEIDFDRFNPEQGAAPALGHFGEVLWHRLVGRKTDAFDVLAGLRSRGIDVLDVRDGRAEGSAAGEDLT